MKRPRSEVLTVTEQFAESTAIHGIPHVFKSRGGLFRGVWLLICALCFGEGAAFLLGSHCLLVCCTCEVSIQEHGICRFLRGRVSMCFFPPKHEHPMTVSQGSCCVQHPETLRFWTTRTTNLTKKTSNILIWSACWELYFLYFRSSRGVGVGAC